MTGRESRPVGRHPRATAKSAKAIVRPGTDRRRHISFDALDRLVRERPYTGAGWSW